MHRRKINKWNFSREVQEVNMLTGEQVKTLIEVNNQEIEKLMKPNQFILNNKIRELLEANAELQKQCPHDFKEGYCNFCFMREPNEG